MFDRIVFELLYEMSLCSIKFLDTTDAVTTATDKAFGTFLSVSHGDHNSVFLLCSYQRSGYVDGHKNRIDYLLERIGPPLMTLR